jgi:hypothetical protein
VEAAALAPSTSATCVASSASLRRDAEVAGGGVGAAGCGNPKIESGLLQALPKWMDDERAMGSPLCVGIAWSLSEYGKLVLNIRIQRYTVWKVAEIGEGHEHS